MLDRQARCLVQLPLGRDLDQLIGDLADAAFHARFARLPGAAAQPVEFDVGVFRSVTREQFHVLDRQEQLVPAGVMHFEAIVRRAGGLDRAQPDEPADTVVDVHDEVASRQTRHLGDEIFGAARGAAWADEPVP